MGYTTTFDGQVKVEPPLTVPEFTKLRNFAVERHEGDLMALYLLYKFEILYNINLTAASSAAWSNS